SRRCARARPRTYREPTRLFTEHTLSVGDVVVALTLAARRGQCELIGCQAEPRCWREFSGVSGRSAIKPDLFVALGVGEYEERWFIEVDRGTEHVPTLLRKCRLYSAYYATGIEQARHGVFPRVCFIVPDDERSKRLAEAVAADRRLTAELFTVTTTEHAVPTLIAGGES
ncbi:MAG: replication-relaxation family protein, partial [Trebonia sp.]